MVPTFLKISVYFNHHTRLSARKIFIAHMLTVTDITDVMKWHCSQLEHLIIRKYSSSHSLSLAILAEEWLESQTNCFNPA